MITEATVATLKSVWPDVLEYLDRGFRQSAIAMAKADPESKTFSQLQSRILMFHAFSNLPEALATELKAGEDAEKEALQRAFEESQR